MAIKELFYDQRPVALLNPRASQRIDPRFKFTRNSTGTYVDNVGFLRSAAVSQSRLDYDPTTGEYLGLLLEDSRTNTVRHSTAMATDATLENVTATDNYAKAPDGTITATRLKANAGLHILRMRKTYYNAGNLAVSVFFKPVVTQTSYGDVHLLFYIDAQNSPTYFNTHTLQAGNGLNVEEWRDGWYRGSFVFKPVSGGNVYFEIRNNTNVIAPITIPATGNEEILLWGAQVESIPEEPWARASSFIPTTGSAATRTADLLSVDSIAIPSSGSIYVDAQALRARSNDTLLSLKNASNQKINLAMEQRSELYNSLALTYSIKGTVKPTLPYPVPTINRERNIITWGTNNYQYNTDGARFAPSLSTTPGIPANLTQLSIGHDAVDPTKAFNGYINAVYLYNGEITPTVAEALVRGELDPINADTYSPVGPTGSLALVINTQGASSSGDKVFALPAESALNDNDIVITWGDGTESGLDGAAAELGAAGLSHTYPSAGIYPIWVEGKLENLQFNNIANAPDLVQIATWGTSANGNDVFLSPSTMREAFFGCSQMNFSTSARTTNLPDTSAVTDWYRAFRDCSSITGTFPAFNFSAATSFQEAWQGCTGLTSFTAAGDQTQNVTNFSSAWYNCTGLTSFPEINTAAGTDFSYAWYNCTDLTIFPGINTAAGTNFSHAWYGCSSLTGFPEINTSSATDLNATWANCFGLTDFPLIVTSAVTTFGATWLNCNSLTYFPLIDTSAGTNFDSAWNSCSSLTSFEQIDTSAATNLSFTWNLCIALADFPLINTSACTNFARTWYTCSSLTSFPPLVLNAATGLASDAGNTFTGFRETWRNCTSLTDFPANRFNTTTCTRFVDAWTGCALSAQSIENILVSINTANTSNGNLGIGGGANAAKTGWSAAANTAYDALVARGWTITFNAT